MSHSSKVTPANSHTEMLMDRSAYTSVIFSTTAQSNLASSSMNTDFTGLVPILSIKGGGLRGLIPAMVLKHLETTSGMDIAKLFPVVAGTSTGGLIACGLTVGDEKGQPLYNCDDLVNCYLNRAKELFPPKSFFGKAKSLFRVKYSGKGLYKLLGEMFGDRDLKAICPDNNLVIVSYDITTHTPIFFKSRKARTEPASYNFQLPNVLRATTAAPTYFKPARISNVSQNCALTCVDGAVIANNPGVCALAEAKKMFPNSSGVLLVSLGCGKDNATFRDRQLDKWGALGWALGPIIKVMMLGMNTTVDYQLKVLMNEKKSEYYDFDPVFNGQVPEMDDAKPATLLQLQQAASQLIADNATILSELAVRLRDLAVQRTFKPREANRNQTAKSMGSLVSEQEDQTLRT